MKFIERLPKPTVLAKKEHTWLEKFLASDKLRPNSSQYAHKEVVETLSMMSSSKCFYCESKLGEHKEVDHYVEVSDDNGRNLVFDWENLYLACSKCNKKLPNKTISNNSTLNPCIDSDVEIAKHLSFHDEQIVDLTEKGKLTIQKYKLNREGLDFLRLKALKDFYKTINVLKTNAMREKRNTLSTKELNILKHFSKKEHAFSLMFSVMLKESGF